MWAGRMTFSGNPGRSSHSLRPPRAGALPRLGSELERKGGAFPLGPAVSTFGRLERLAAGRPAKPARPAGGGSGGSLRPPRPPHGWRPTMTTQGLSAQPLTPRVLLASVSVRGPDLRQTAPSRRLRDHRRPDHEGVVGRHGFAAAVVEREDDPVGARRQARHIERSPVAVAGVEALLGEPILVAGQVVAVVDGAVVPVAFGPVMAVVAGFVRDPERAQWERRRVRLRRLADSDAG